MALGSRQPRDPQKAADNQRFVRERIAKAGETKRTEAEAAAKAADRRKGNAGSS